MNAMDSTENTSNSEQIKLIQLQQFLSQLPTLLIAQAIVAVPVVYLTSHYTNFAGINLWVMGFCLILLLRSAMYFHHKTHASTLQNRQRRVVWHTFAGGAMGALWGGLAFFTMQGANDPFTLLIVTVLIGMVASSVTSTAHLRPLFILHSITTLAPVALKFSLLGGPVFTAFSFLIVVFCVLTTLLSNSLQRTVVDSIQLRLNNLRLIGNLTHEKLRAEQSQRKAEAALLVAENANKAKTQFLAAASHDLRQPLHALRLLNSTLERTELNAEQAPLVQNMSSSVQSLKELLNSLLDISKLDAGTQSIEISNSALSNVFDALERHYAPVAESYEATLIFKPTKSIVCTDIILIERLLSNLISNALRYSPGGTVTVSDTLINERSVISVSDTGVGIHSEDQARIFEEFVQLDNPERDRSKGIGLGLAIVRRTAELLELSISLKSEPGVGSTFSVTVPTGDLQVNSIQPAEEENAIDDFDGLLVLVIDDELSVREAMDYLLDSWGCVTLTAGDGDEAENIIREIDTLPDAIIADLRLRDNETGVDVVERIHRVFDSTCPALILTGETAPNRLRQLNDSAYPILHKPCDPYELNQFLRQAEQRVKMPAFA